MTVVSPDPENIGKARLYIRTRSGRVIERTYSSGPIAYEALVSLPAGTQVAYRTAGNSSPLYPHDFHVQV